MATYRDIASAAARRLRSNSSSEVFWATSNRQTPSNIETISNGERMTRNRRNLSDIALGVMFLPPPAYSPDPVRFLSARRAFPTCGEAGTRGAQWRCRQHQLPSHIHV